jgi:1-deoxy-D-xylulose-5-phosphate reductoisomerase
VKQIAILGSTGSIGVSTLDVVSAFPDAFRVISLAAGGNVELLAEQVLRFRPESVAVRDAEVAGALEERIGGICKVLLGPAGLVEVATWPRVELVVSAIVGAVGMPPTYAAVCSGRDIALANKEALVVAGERMTEAAAASGSKILPVDSEHNALDQCLRGEATSEVRRLWLTASGGPFRKHTAAQLAGVTRDQALRHPTWNMGPKITIDSATLMNKGLEVIEARWLFGLGPDRIRVVVHPQSVVHSMVEFIDGSFKAQLGITDMRHPIQYALSWPSRWTTELPEFDPLAVGSLDFEAPDLDRFPCLGLAYSALEEGGAAPAVLNAANEVAVQAFLDERASFAEIPSLIREALDRHAGEPAASVEQLLDADRRTRATAAEILERGVRA